MSTWRNPLVPAGLLLVLLGLGNWYTGLDKSAEHEHMLAAGNLAPPLQQFYEFDKLTARTNASLLTVFQRGSDPSTLINAKLDFYRVVYAGGRMLILLGVFAMAAGCIHSWYRQRRTERSLESRRAY
jgi:hypothetical protein